MKYSEKCEQFKGTIENLDRINYGRSLEKDVGSLELNQDWDYCLEESSVVKETYDSIEKILPNKHHVGVISTGTHTRDYVNYYNISSDFENWADEAVMYVYECPADNSALSFANKSSSSEKNCYNRNKNHYARVACESFINSKAEFKDHLCRCLWHVDNEEDPDSLKVTEIGGFNKFNYFDKNKVYGRFMISIIEEFKLANFYTTNMFRYEIFKSDNNQEKALNLREIIQCLENRENEDITPDKEYLGVFIEELKALKPKVIFATSNPYGILQKWMERELADDVLREILQNAVLIKVPHTANRDNNSERYLKNAVNIILGLNKGEVIESDFAKEKLIEMYIRYPEIHNNRNFYTFGQNHGK